tara:strand:- start:220 stop:423 length:204 start_codon:yes stop_codon:yes gene_type:complete
MINYFLVMISTPIKIYLIGPRIIIIWIYIYFFIAVLNKTIKIRTVFLKKSSIKSVINKFNLTFNNNQ